MKRDEQTIQYRKKLDKLEQQIAENKARQKKAADDAKVLRRKKATAERNMRTHRLCVLGALLEKQLKEPDLLSDSDVEQILERTFSDPAIAERLNKALEFRRTHPIVEDDPNES